MHRVLFHVGDYAIYSFGVMVALGVLAASLLAGREAPRVGVSREQALEGAVWLVVIGVLLARLAYVAQEAGWFAAHPAEIVNFRGGGMSWHGAIVALFVGVAVLARRMGASVADLLDLYSPSMMLGLAVGRIGCLLNGCCYGRESRLPWALPIPDERTGLPVLRHPTPLYEMAAALLVMFILLYWLRHRRAPGDVFAGFLLLYSLVRFVVEFFRAGTLLAGHLSLAQYVSLGLMLGSGAWLLLRRAPPRAPA